MRNGQAADGEGEMGNRMEMLPLYHLLLICMYILIHIETCSYQRRSLPALASDSPTLLLSLSPPPSHKDQNQTQQTLRYGTAGALVRLEVRVEGLAIGAPPRGGSVGQIVVLGGGGGGGGEGGLHSREGGRGEKASVRAGRTRAS